MSKRKGEITSAQIDREFPHQVIIRADDMAGGLGDLFCANAGVPVRTHSVRESDEWHIVFCFADEIHADQFVALFGAERFDPKTRGRSTGWAHLK